MTDKEHTPGPWSARKGHDDFIIDGAGGEVWALAAVVDGNDARLIAAAPDMLKALQSAAGYLTNAAIDLQTGAKKQTALNTIEGGLRLVRAAIAKATEPQPTHLTPG